MPASNADAPARSRAARTLDYLPDCLIRVRRPSPDEGRSLELRRFQGGEGEPGSRRWLLRAGHRRADRACNPPAASFRSRCGLARPRAASGCVRRRWSWLSLAGRARARSCARYADRRPARAPVTPCAGTRDSGASDPRAGVRPAESRHRTRESRISSAPRPPIGPSSRSKAAFADAVPRAAAKTTSSRVDHRHTITATSPIPICCPWN